MIFLPGLSRGRPCTTKMELVLDDEGVGRGLLKLQGRWNENGLPG